MQYLALIYEEEGRRMSPDQQRAVIGGYRDFNTQGREQQAIVAGEALQPTTTATTVRVRDGEVLMTDGPFAETREALGGFYLLDCANLDEAVAMAARIPTAKTGCVEVRPIMAISWDD